jgi:hypothetical protein
MMRGTMSRRIRRPLPEVSPQAAKLMPARCHARCASSFPGDPLTAVRFNQPATA